MRATFAGAVVVGGVCCLLSADAQAGSAAPWARLVEAKPLASNAALLVEAFGHGAPVFKVRSGEKAVELATTERWPVARLPSEGQGALFALRPKSGSWPAGTALTLELYQPSELGHVWKTFTQEVTPTPDTAPPTVAGTPFMTGQNLQTLSIPIMGERTNRWVSFGRVDDTAARVRATLRLEVVSSGKPHTVETSFRPGAGFRVPLDAAHEYRFLGAELKDSAGNTTQVSSSATTRSAGGTTTETKKGCDCALAPGAGTRSEFPPVWWLVLGCSWLARRRLSYSTEVRPSEHRLERRPVEPMPTPQI